MNWLKLLSRSGRQAMVRDAVREYLTIQKVSELAADGVSKLLAQSCAGISEEKMQRVCGYCRDGATLFAAISSAVADKVVTTEEAAEICTQVAQLTGDIVTQARIDSVIAAIMARVP